MPRSRGQQIWLAERAAEHIRATADAEHPAEAGGILLGVLACGNPWITQAVHIASTTATPSYYEIPAGATRRAVRLARSTDPRVGYLGDWHSHPANVAASQVDLGTMRRVATDSRAGVVQPLLIIARRVGDGYELDAHQLVHRRLKQIRIVASGPLATPTPLP